MTGHGVKHCPRCDGDTEVYDARTTKKGFIRRGRRCKKCGYRFYTLEVQFFDAPKELQDR